MKRSFWPVVWLAVLGGSLLACQLFEGLAVPGPGSGADQRQEGSLLLNEVVFAAAQGQSPFVELRAVGSAELAGTRLRNSDGEEYLLPQGLPSLADGELLVIQFDGRDQIQGTVVHADRTGFVAPRSGFLELLAADETLLDRVAWGVDQPAAVRLGRGGVLDELEPGSSIGRAPHSIRMDPQSWALYSPQQVTPGGANPQPEVSVMLPLNGAVLQEASFELSWYPAAGAVSYVVQIAADDGFASLQVDQPTNEPNLAVTLQPGTYYWRVQAIGASGLGAAHSPPQRLVIRPDFSSGRLASPARQSVLAVPFLSQYKDSSMLLLETPMEIGDHAWDVAHPGLHRSDPADNMNCVLASVAMVNAFFGGQLSQDRIGYEILKDTFPGPDGDLNYGRGFYDPEVSEALSFALGGEPEYQRTPGSADAIWSLIKAEIDFGVPLLAKVPGHVFVVSGYYDQGDTRYVMIHDPWWGMYAVSLAEVPWRSFWRMPLNGEAKSDEAEIRMDSDGDGINDFDEIHRFGTNPADVDTDKDEVRDKDDVRASVFDEKYGYGATGSYLGRDFDFDGLAMELDEDSDGGGCFDGIEDFDHDGKHEEREAYNFDDGDDACFWGTDELVLDETYTYDDGSYHHQRLRTYASFSLQAVEGGRLEGIARITYTHTGEFFSDVCSGSHDIGEQNFQARLEGEFQGLPDGGTFVTFRATPNHGEPYVVQWNTACPAEADLNDGWHWGGQSGTLVNGQYDRYDDFSTAVGSSGEFWQRVHFEGGPRE